MRKTFEEIVRVNEAGDFKFINGINDCFKMKTDLDCFKVWALVSNDPNSLDDAWDDWNSFCDLWNSEDPEFLWGMRLAAHRNYRAARALLAIRVLPSSTRLSWDIHCTPGYIRDINSVTPEIKDALRYADKILKGSRGGKVLWR